MIILKFGGTSISSSIRIKELASLINTPEQKIIVLSAMSGTTNSLVEIADYLYKKDNHRANQLISDLEDKYYQVVSDLFSTSKYQKKGNELIKSHFNYINSFTLDMFTLYGEKAILAQGELLSTALFHYYLNEKKKRFCSSSRS